MGCYARSAQPRSSYGLRFGTGSSHFPQKAKSQWHGETSSPPSAGRLRSTTMSPKITSLSPCSSIQTTELVVHSQPRSDSTLSACAGLQGASSMDKITLHSCLACCSNREIQEDAFERIFLPYHHLCFEAAEKKSPSAPIPLSRGLDLPAQQLSSPRHFVPFL